MSGFTYASGIQTETMSLRCPICLSHRPVTIDMLRITVSGGVPLEQLCCSPAHIVAYREKVYRIEKTLWLALQRKTRLPTKVARRINQTGGLSTLVTEHLKHYYNGE